MDNYTKPQALAVLRGVRMLKNLKGEPQSVLSGPGIHSSLEKERTRSGLQTLVSQRLFWVGTERV